MEDACAAIPECGSLPFHVVLAAWKRATARHLTLAQTLAGSHLRVTPAVNPPGNALALTLAWACLVLVGILSLWVIFGKGTLLETIAPKEPTDAATPTLRDKKSPKDP